MADSADEPEIFAAATKLQNQARWADALALYRRLPEARLTLRAIGNLGVCLTELGQFEEARLRLQVAARHRPSNPDIRQRLGSVYAAAGEIALAEIEFRTALAFAPEHRHAQLALAGLLLSVGRYDEGWPLLEARAALYPEVIPAGPAWPQWAGEPLEGRSVFIHVEQGLGDQIQMIRFAQALKARGAGRVVAGCRGPLTSLFLTAPGVDAVVALDPGAQARLEPMGCWTRYFSLPRWLDVGEGDLWPGAYLFASEDRKARWKPKARVGLAWQASPTGFNGANKSLPLALAQRILDRGAMSLHPEDTGAADMADTAAIIDGLDLVISIDTSVAHLAGAMGKPCLTLLPGLKTDWRWLRGRTDSPWYPGMRLYRQATPGDWGPQVEAVLADLGAVLG
ncbi:tetratricopeptide repeat-containing glycosyltransferase family protein [Phenylobacterium sp. J367]|uniref:tetratricopeptide repeat-containing glycosyltransferase family protein n=1 Tax=Phenylobacterium sp. J367 TaxID=2898435 RepID=UPI002151B620|nr:tetratricopeptide repeat-containing glycosyltransferase family protein [Phenylobacterium sp. J367]MCR5879198.1 tetratricopeptide repeat-containing glycosyltransferase family protein [Phenylobacterium sp. J367]